MAKAQQVVGALCVAVAALTNWSPARSAVPAGCDVLSAPKLELPAVFTDDGLLYLRVSLNGGPERWFELDTGTMPSVVDLAYARLAKLDLTGHTGHGDGAGADRPQYIQTHADAQAGALAVPNISIQALNFAPPGPDAQPIGGVLGTSFLKHMLLIADYRNRKAWISEGSLARCSNAQSFRLRYNIVVTRIKVGGKPIDAIVDSGGVYDLLVQPSAAPALGLSEVMAKGESGVGYGYGGKVDVRGGIGPSLDVGQIHHAQSEAAFIPIPLKVYVAIGTHFLRHTRMTIDYRSRKIMFEE
jgi:hypothetical protein